MEPTADAFPSPRGVELHKPMVHWGRYTQAILGFRPLAGLSCINLEYYHPKVIFLESFRPLAGLSCINREP